MSDDITKWMQCFDDIDERIDVPPIRVVHSETSGWLFEHLCVRDYGTQWCAGPLGAHDLISTDPIHFEPSVLCGNCGAHGFIRDGQWIDAGKTPPPLPDLEHPQGAS